MTQTNAQIINEIKGLTADSRNIEDGYLFAAFPGTTTDGRLFIPQAIEAGATYILAPKGTILNEDDAERVTLIEDDNPRLRFALLAEAFYKRKPEHVVAVTGTSGKTSTANFTSQLWTLLGHRAASLGTLGVLTPEGQSNAGLTTMAAEDLFATMADLKDNNINHVAMEASSIGIDQYRMHGLPIASAAFTNLSRDHLDYHKDMDEYFECKARLFTELLDQQNGTATICVDDEWGETLYNRLKNDFKGQLWSYGYKGHDFKIISQKAHARGQLLNVEIFGKPHEIDLPLAGLFQGLNVIAAMALALGADQTLTSEKVIPLLPKLTSVSGRMESITGHPKGAGVIVDYAHKPGALEAVLTTLADHVEGKLICLFGCGGNRDKGKRPEMAAIAAKFSDHVIITDDNPRHEDPTQIRNDIVDGLPKGTSFENIGDRTVAIRSAVSSLEDGDVLVIAGKGHEQGQTISGVTHPFDDRDEARKSIKILAEELR